ncbi:hypothetical protein PRIC2_012781 [Phytophthora ramorum]
MEDGRDEEVQREAMPPSPADERSLPQCVAPPAEQRRSIHRQSILYPLVAGFLPVGTVVHESARKLSSPHTLLSPEMGYGAKVQPSDIIGMTGGSERILNTDITSVTEFSMRADMQIFPLRFRDTVQEEAFCKHFNVYVAQKVRVASQIVILINVIMLVAQFLTQLRLLNNPVFVSRIAILALSVIFQAATFTSWFRRNFDRNLLAHYLLLDFAHQLPRFLFLVGSLEEEAEEASTGTKTDELTLFASQKSVRAMNLIFILVIFIASGMRFTMASVCACYHMVVKGLFAVIFCHECTWDDMDTTTNVAMITFCTLTAYHSERYVRQEFLERLRVDDERKRRDNLLETMLPVHIKERLKDNRTDGLAESYDEVSILFCYVSNFQALSKHTSAIELVQLMNRIIFCFDRATDAHGVYKVEAIAETYMCAAGVPQRDPFHCEKVADMALTMMRICEKESWSFNGVDIQLQMGIHSGPVVAGVVGSKTYSYHLFGDTVNTSSRVCSSGCAGKIQISSRSRELLARTVHFGYKRELGLRHDFLLKCTLELEKQKCEDLLTNMLPSKQYAEALMQQSTIVDELAEVTLLYSDMVGFTPLGAKLDPAGICVMLNQIYSAFDRHLDDLGVYKMDTVGDAFIVVGGLPGHKSSKNHAAAIAAFAVEMLHEIDRFCAEENVTLQMRIGIHTGNVVGGVVGIKKPRYLIWGRHTVIANLMESRGVAGRIQLSETTYAHLRGCPEFRIEERADRVQISENDTIRTYFLEPGHLAVKDAVMARYLQEDRRVGTAEIFALDQLRTCLLPSTNSPLSRRLEVPLSRRRHSDQQAASGGEVVPAPPALVKTFSFGSMMNDR